MQHHQRGSDIEDPLSHEAIQQIVTKCIEQVGWYALKHNLSEEGQERMVFEKISRELWFASAREAAHRSGIELPSALKKIIIQCYSKDANLKAEGSHLLNAWLRENCKAAQRHTFTGILNAVVKKTVQYYTKSKFYRGTPNLPMKTFSFKKPRKSPSTFSKPKKKKVLGFKLRK